MPPADRPASTPVASSSVFLRILQGSFVFAVAGFAWWRFSDNTADNDLWGHVLYGQRYWLQGHVRGTEMLSWTAAGHEVVNHEYLAEIVMGWVHRVAGGTGLWLYMLAMGSVTITLALSAGRGAGGVFRWTVLALFAASINFIALGYAVRPQLFTTLALVVELILLRRIASGRFAWGLLVPLLIAVWGNLHGGVIAGVVILVLMTGVETLHALWPRPLGNAWESTRPPRRHLAIYWWLLLLAWFALLLNPWGYGLIRWNLNAILLPRPQIHEWQPLTFSAAHAPFYIVASISLLAWSLSRRPRQAWEAASLLLLGVMGILHQRHAPLFGLANLVFTPPHLEDLARRIAPHCRDLLAAFARPAVQAVISVTLAGAGIAGVTASFSAPKEHPFTIEVERNVYPVAAVEFIQAQRLYGKTITFFDWGQENLWELPNNPVSFDGRFDTGYPAPVIAAHWDFYQGKALRSEVNWNEADVALLPVDSGGATLLLQSGWRSVYRDPLATVLVRANGSHGGFVGDPKALRQGLEVLQGRKRFPDSPAVLATAAAPR